MNRRSIALFFLITAFLYAACHTHIADYEQGPVTVKLTSLGGDSYKSESGDASYFMPYPLDVGRIISSNDKEQVIIVGKGVKRLDDIGVVPFKEFTFADEPGDTIKVVVAYPSDIRLSIGMDTHRKMSDNELYPLMHIIEYWYTHKDGLNGRHKLRERSVTAADYQ